MTFHFDKNEFFTNENLSFSAHYNNDEIVYSKGTFINWTKNPTKKIINKT